VTNLLIIVRQHSLPVTGSIKSDNITFIFPRSDVRYLNTVCFISFIHDMQAVTNHGASS